MGRFVEGTDRSQTTLCPECLDDWIDEDNPVRVIDAFVDSIDLGELGFDGVVPEATGRPAYHPAPYESEDVTPDGRLVIDGQTVAVPTGCPPG
jgi:transposase